MSVEQEVGIIYKQLMDDLTHPYVNSILPKPSIDKDKLLVYYMLFQTKVNREMAGVYAKSVMIAEVGLSTHETMTVAKLSMKDDIKRRQLTALSGDFYSALYYYSLARNNNTRIVKWVAQAIQIFNIEKCRLYYPKREFGWPQAIEALGSTESALVSQIASKLGLKSWIPVLSDFFLAKKLVGESRDASARTLQSFLNQYLREQLTSDPHQFRQNIEKEVLSSAERFRKSSAKAEKQTGKLADLLAYLNDQMHNYCRCMVEEG
ncbi:heptaprenyl diphosphate synthase [Sporolactobacillus shoreae]|uniref:Heptaprenyl diphosphate synthase n=1 Tax=Sporolactobacillus shoreae TaxID=1465501 RepID=A0A4Z0GM63_9BACL|nr:heptaprenyl diphosphate synthase component 1 [Sporolactobacillus shoreae]TGA98129.1 heptaprenyl diphosphate synthase [Sporolactobacillus shoreae]